MHLTAYFRLGGRGERRGVEGKEERDRERKGGGRGKEGRAEGGGRMGEGLADQSIDRITSGFLIRRTQISRQILTRSSNTKRPINTVYQYIMSYRVAPFVPYRTVTCRTVSCFVVPYYTVPYCPVP